MAPRSLTTQSMVAVGARWLDPGQERPILERYPLSRVLLNHLETAHARLVECQRRSTAGEEALRHLSERLDALDAQHDRLVRGVCGMLTSLAELADGAECATHFLDLRDKLFPDGASGVACSYVDRSAEAVRLQGRLNERTGRSLLTILTPNGSLYGHVQDLIDVAREMGELAAERAKVAKARGATTRGDVVDTRSEWIRVVTALRAALALDGVSAEDHHRIFRHLDAAEAKADRRMQPSNDTGARIERQSSPPCGSQREPADSEPAPDSVA